MTTPTPFVSTLALDMRKIIDPTQLHVLYGASKDFCANGLRLGCIYSKNKGLLGAISSIRYSFTTLIKVVALTHLKPILLVTSYSSRCLGGHARRQGVDTAHDAEKDEAHDGRLSNNYLVSEAE